MNAVSESGVSRFLKRVLENAMVAIPEQQQGIGGNIEGAKLAEKLGLKQQAVRYQMTGTDIRTTFAEFLLSETELTIWRNYCPTSYVEGTEEFEAYRFETVPVPVLKHWDELKQQHPFDHFEIWTTEQRARATASDPLLIGVFEGGFYLLARWGKEAKDLLSYSEVCDRVYDRFHEYFTLNELPKKIADRLRQLQNTKLGRISRSFQDDFRFLSITRKHCGVRSLAFEFLDHDRRIHSLCPSCGESKDIGETHYRGSLM